MRVRLSRTVSAAVFAVAVLLSLLSGSTQAHPRLVGAWVAQDPPGTLMKYEFGPGEYQGNWVWRGPVRFHLANEVVSTGTYELRMFNGLEGGLTIRDGNGLPNDNGIVNLGTRVLNYKSVVFRAPAVPAASGSQGSSGTGMSK
jgi:hypothetical protein